MSSNDDDKPVQNLTTQIENLKTNENGINKSEDFYIPNAKVGYARLEKGLLLFVYLFETNPIELLRNKCKKRRICYYTLIGKSCPNESTCKLDHKEKFRQPNLCKIWYEKNKCSLKDCPSEDEFKFDADHETSPIINDTDRDVYDLIRFVRNFASHFVPSTVDKKTIQSLYKEIIILMIHIIGCTARKVEQMNLFLHKSTINQLKINFLEMIIDETAYEVPSVFFHNNSINFKDKWYHDWLNGTFKTKNGILARSIKTKVSFSSVSPQFRNCLADQLKQYFYERLENRGTDLDADFYR